MVAVWLSLCIGTVLGLEIGFDTWNPVMQDSDYLAETSAARIEPADFLSREITVPTFPELDATNQHDQVTLLEEEKYSKYVAKKFSGKTALPDAVQFLNHDEAVHMHPSISDPVSLQRCQNDPKCNWIWGTSQLLTGARVKITGVIGKFNTSIAGTRCHVTSQENLVRCHRADPSLKLTRGEAYLLMAVPTAFPNQPPLPVAAMCHYKSATPTNSDSTRWDRWCHLISCKEFIVVPSEGFTKIGVHADDVKASDLEERQMILALGRNDHIHVARLASGEQVSIAYVSHC